MAVCCHEDTTTIKIFLFFENLCTLTPCELLLFWLSSIETSKQKPKIIYKYFVVILMYYFILSLKLLHTCPFLYLVLKCTARCGWRR
jgi:hypothetical protein